MYSYIENMIINVYFLQDKYVKRIFINLYILNMIQ